MIFFIVIDADIAIVIGIPYNQFPEKYGNREMVIDTNIVNLGNNYIVFGKIKNN